MRVCPKCGYADPPHWKHVKYSFYIDSCSFENFQLMYPNLAEVLWHSKITEDNYYVYRLTKDKTWVERKAKLDYAIQSWSDKTEKSAVPTSNKRLKLNANLRYSTIHDRMRYWGLLHPNQTRLDGQHRLDDIEQKKAQPP